MSQQTETSKKAPTAREVWRTTNLKRIRRMTRRIIYPQHPMEHNIKPEIYSQLPISITRLPFDDEIDFDIRFSKLFDESTLETLYNNILGTDGKRLDWPKRYGEYRLESQTSGWGQQWAYLLDRACSSRPPRTSSSWADITSSGPCIYEYSKWRGPDRFFFYGQKAPVICEGWRWCTTGVFMVTPHVVPKPNRSYVDRQPHISCILHHHAPMDERVPRSELIVLLELIKQRLRYPAWNHHAIIPVFVYSFNNLEARVTQAHFDGTTLHLRRTDPIDMTVEPVSKIKLLMRWVMAEPIGDTQFHDPRELIDVDPKRAEDNPSTPRQTAIHTDDSDPPPAPKKGLWKDKACPLSKPISKLGSAV